MSNRARRRHLHKPRENRSVRARQEWEHGKYPTVPGVIADRSQEAIDEAMAQGHHVLPYLPGTAVTVRVFDVEPGLRLVGELFGKDAVVACRELLLARGGSDPAIVITSRERPE